jgi:hypothetical protein
MNTTLENKHVRQVLARLRSLGEIERPEQQRRIGACVRKGKLAGIAHGD